MKNISIILLIFTLVSCASNSGNRNISSTDTATIPTAKIKNFEGNHFGNVKYGDNTRGVGLYLQKVPNQDAYYGLLAEYLSPFEEKNFIWNFLRPGKKKFFSKKKNGYLKDLLNRVMLYRFDRIPGKQSYSLSKLRVKNGQIQTAGIVPQAELRIRGKLIKGNPMKNSILFLNIDGEKTLTNFRGSNRFGFAAKSKLNSRWEKDYVEGNYNPGYKEGDIINLKLGSFDAPKNTAIAQFDATTLRKERIQGNFNVREDIRGMYTFQARDKTVLAGKDIVEDKIGIFFDVFDAQGLGMDTVELVLVDPANAKTSQMYFEEYGNAN